MFGLDKRKVIDEKTESIGFLLFCRNRAAFHACYFIYTVSVYEAIRLFIFRLREQKSSAADSILCGRGGYELMKKSLNDSITPAECVEKARMKSRFPI